MVKFKKLQCVNSSSMGCEKIIVTFIKKQHTSEKWIEACTKSYLTLIKNKILWNYAQVWKLHFKLFIVMFQTYTITLHSYHLSIYEE